MGTFWGTAPFYAVYRPGYPSELIERLAAAAGLTRDSRVLDLACGTGKVAVPLAAYAGEVVGVDVEAEMLAEVAAPVRTLQANAEDVDATWGSFDLVTIGRALHWLGGPPYLERLVPLTPQVALLGDRIGDSEAQSIVLEVSQRFRERPVPPAPRFSYREALLDSSFDDVVELTAFDERVWTPDSLIGYAYSTSFAPTDRREEFERELRARLAPEYRERVPVSALLGRRRDGLEPPA